MVLSGTETTTGGQAVKSKTASSSSSTSAATAAAAALTASMNNNMYRVGDYVYFEVHAGQPYQIRKIEELSRTSSGAQVEVKVQCFYRRRDMPTSLINMADKHYSYLEEENEIQSMENLDDEMKHQLRHRELFLSRQSENVPAQYIRGKCCVNLLSEVETMSSYLSNKDQFFYTLVFDPVQKSLQADRGEMRVGARFQAEVKPFNSQEAEKIKKEYRRNEDLDELVWNPDNGLSGAAIGAVVSTIKSVGTLARAVDFNNHAVKDTSMSSNYTSSSSSAKDPGLLVAASSASRDISLAYAYSSIHKHNYDMSEIMLSLVPGTGMLMVRDEIEVWSVFEANLFEEALEKFGKDFALIKEQVLPWKTLNTVIEYYYMWKTTDRYMRQKRRKAADVDQRLKQVYIPSDGTVNNPNKTTVTPATRIICEGCETDEASSWYLWGPNNACRLCGVCWCYWKKYGGLIKPNYYEGNIISSSVSAETARYECRSCGKLFNRQERLINHMASHGEYTCTVGQCDKDFKSRNQLHRHLATAHKLVLTKKDTYVPAVRSRTAFLLVTTPFSQYSRNFCSVTVKSLARRPCVDFDQDACQKETLKTANKANFDLKNALSRPRKSSSKKASLEFLAEKIKIFNQQTEKMPGGAPRVKRKLPCISLPICSAKRKRINWVEQNDGVIFIQNEKTLRLRNLLTLPQQRKCGRRPCVLALPDMGRG